MNFKSILIKARDSETGLKLGEARGKSGKWGPYSPFQGVNWSVAAAARYFCGCKTRFP